VTGRVLTVVLTLLAALLLADWGYSSLAPCGPVSNQASQATEPQQPPKDCAALHGPVAAVFVWTGDILREEGEAVIAVFTVVLAVSTILLWRATERLFEAGEAQRQHAERVAERQADEMKKSLDLADRSANIAKLASLAIDRPWIKVDAHLTGDLVFGNEYIETRVEVALRNVGKSPAIRVGFDAMLYTDLGTASENSEDRIRNWRLAQPGLNMPNYGFVVFPDDAPLKRDGRLRLRTEKFRQRIKWRLETLAETENRESGRFENPALMVLAWYTISGSDEAHHTLALFQIVRKSKRGFDGTEGVVPQNDLWFRQETMAGKAD
jgi:hypothetical protein